MVLKSVKKVNGKYKVKSKLQPVEAEGFYAGNISKAWQYNRFIISFNWNHDNLVQIVYLDNKKDIREAIWENFI